MTSPIRFALLACVALSLYGAAHAQDTISIGANVNMVTGQSFPNGDPFQRQQNEPSVAFSSRNNLHLLAGANDYRAVDVPGLPGGRETGDSWLSYFWSTNGGATWKSTLIPGYPQDPACQSASPPALCDYAAGADPVVRAGVNGMFYYSGIVFERSDPSRSAIFVSRFIDLNNDEGGDPIRFIDTTIIDANDDGSVFLDKSWIGVDIPRADVTDTVVVTQSDGSTVNQTVACGNIYVGYAAIGGEGQDLRSEIRMATSTDCGNIWANQVISEADTLNQGANIAIQPNTGDVHVAWRRFDTVESFLGISPVGCPASPSSWEVNSAWPVTTITVGGIEYSVEAAQELLGRKHRGDESIKLAYEVIAAKLNLLTGGGDPVPGFNSYAWGQELNGFIDDAEAWFIDNPIGSDPKQTAKKAGQTIKKSIQKILQGSGSCTDNATVTEETTTGASNAIMVASSDDLGETFSTPVMIDESTTFDQGSTRFSFRTTAYPTIAADTTGRVYVAWAARGKATIRGEADTGDARIVLSTSGDGQSWIEPYVIDEPNREGHQIKPSMLFAGGQLTVVFYDFRQDVSDIFEGFVVDLPEPDRLRHTVDVRIATATPGTTPQFTDYSLLSPTDSDPVSRYAFYLTNGGGDGAQSIQLEYMVPNYPMFADGTTPFIGDYVDIAAPNLILDDDGWRFASQLGDVQVWQAVWSDNRDVIPPPDGDWSKYVAPIDQAQPSFFDPAVMIPSCQNVEFLDAPMGLQAGSLYTGTRNQNVYSASISNGVIIAAPGNNRPLGLDATGAPLQRGFVVYIQNTTPQARDFILSLPEVTIGDPLQASFAPSELLTQKSVEIPPYSSAVATVYATNTGGATSETILVSVAEPGGALVGTVRLNSDPGAPDPLQTTLATTEVHNPLISNPTSLLNDSIDPMSPEYLTCTTDPAKCVLNPAIFNPAILNPAIFNPAILNPAIFNPAIFNPAILNPAIFNPAIFNPAILNPAILNPAIFNPAIFNPAILNPAILNPAILNPAILNPAILNPAILNPAILNPAILNPAILNPAILNSTPESNPEQVDVTFAVTNEGNATTAYDLDLAAEQIDGLDYEVLVYRLNETPVTDGCTLTTEAQQQLIFSQDDPLNKGVDGTFYLEPGEQVLVTFRVLPDLEGELPLLDPVVEFDPDDLGGIVSAQPPNTNPASEPPADQFGPPANTVSGEAGGTVNGGGIVPPVNFGPLAAGEQVSITATGFVRRGDSFPLDTPNGSGPCDSSCLSATAPALSLIARIGSGPWQFVGEGPTVLTATTAGDLELAVNDNDFNNNTGAFFVSVSPIADTVVSTFDTDADGWVIANDGVPAWIATGGNPGGYFRATDQGSGQYWYFDAPAKFLGDRSTSYGGELSYDLQRFSGAFNAAFPPWVVLAGDGLTLIYDASAQGAPALSSWSSYVVPLDANSPGWYVSTNNCWTGTGDSCGFTGATPPTAAQFQRVLANLDTLLIRGEYTIGGDSAGLDNVLLSGSVSTAPGLTNSWPGDGTANDVVGGSDGQLFGGATFGSGFVNQSFVFDGIDDFMDIGQPLSESEGTVSFWVRRNDDFTGGGDVFFGGVGSNVQRTPTLFVRSGGTLLWEFNNITVQNTGVPINIGQWHHVAMTWNSVGATSNLEVWVDGVLADSVSGAATPTDFQANVLVGAYQDLGTINQYANASIDELDLFDRALTGAEIQAIIDADSASGNAGPPVSLWQADGNALDSVGSNDGTLINGANYAAGIIGQAFSLDGGGAYVGVPDSPSLQMSATMSMAAWIYPTGPGNGTHPIIVNKEGEYEMARDADGSIDWAFDGPVNDPSPGDWIWRFGAPAGSAPLNTWTHVAITYKDGEVITYINGVVTGINGAPLSSGSPLPPIPSPILDFAPSLNELRIGGRQAFSARELFQGLIDDVRVYNTTLTPAEVVDLVNAASF